MLVLLSPAKTLDMSPVDRPATDPRLLDHTRQLAGVLKKKSPADLSELMSISDKLADLNFERFQAFQPAPVGKPALLAFKGDVYQDLEAADFSPQEFTFANQQLRILSGFYGILRPADLMQAYRLEMGTRLTTVRGANLYEFWGDRLTQLLDRDLQEEGSGLMLNLASKEYFRSLDPAGINGRILNIDFREKRKGKYRFITFNAKRARGRMARLITLEGIRTAEPLKELVVNDYVYSDEQSAGDNWTFVKD
ncbi:peroxide stress protein YaaA [Lewinella sp. IMCC34183]|uniref:peroxide stress protein YaaA n=1 Tax=Lewinella sp. IMCC34183 TaxID=2248762 RepID=UPI000E280E55|nr:peroxide stress protein YaaA [Lewinella sp. IMCC34183]